MFVINELEILYQIYSIFVRWILYILIILVDTVYDPVGIHIWAFVNFNLVIMVWYMCMRRNLQALNNLRSYLDPYWGLYIIDLSQYRLVLLLTRMFTTQLAYGFGSWWDPILIYDVFSSYCFWTDFQYCLVSIENFFYEKLDTYWYFSYFCAIIKTHGYEQELMFVKGLPLFGKEDNLFPVVWKAVYMYEAWYGWC